MGSTYVEARISNFIYRKLATTGDAIKHTARKTSMPSGIYYEQLALPRQMNKKVQ